LVEEMCFQPSSELTKRKSIADSGNSNMEVSSAELCQVKVKVWTLAIASLT